VKNFLFNRGLLLSGALTFSAFMWHCGGSGNVGAVLDPNISFQGCGDNLLEAGEGCDDGNTNNSDGCNLHCALEVGEAICGNGVKENEECCDDGNMVSGDGCSANCTLENPNHAPSAPALAGEPHNGVKWAPTRLYLSWSSSTDPDAEDQVVYDVYFVEGNGISPNAIPYKKGITQTHFIIQASTDNRSEFFPDVVSPLYLAPLRTYTWKICARDKFGATACSIQRIFNTDDSVVGWWRFDENPAGSACPPLLGGPAGDFGETVCDYSGKGNHGVPQGGIVWIPSLNNGILGAAIEVEENYIVVPNSPSLNPSNTLTVEVMQYLKSFGDTTDRPFLSKLSSSEATDNTGYAFSFGRGTDIYLWIGNRLFGLSFVATLNEWEHLIGVYNGNDASLYKNGILLSTQTMNGNILNNTNPLWIAHSSRFNSFYEGRMSEVLIYSRDLMADEVKNSFLNY